MKTLIAIIITLGLATSSFAQGVYSLSYTASFSAGEMNDFIENTSFRGLSFDARFLLSENLSIGAYTNWTTFYEKMPNEIYSDETISISGIQYRYINSFPIMFNTHYYKNLTDNGLQIYTGVGIGTYYINQVTEMGLWQVEDKVWHFGFAPELGFLVPAGPIDLNLSLKWNYALKAKDSIDYSWFGLNVGIAWENQ